MRTPQRVPFPTALVTLGTGIFGGYALVGGSAGVGFLLTALAATTAILLADRGFVRSPERLAMGLLGLALIAQTAILDAEWLIAIDLLAALWFAALAVAGVSTWTTLVKSASRSLANAAMAPVWVVMGLFERWGPVKREDLGPVLRGSLFALPLLLIFGSLLISADSAFAQITEDLLYPSWDDQLLGERAFAGLLVVAITGGLAITLLRSQVPASEESSMFAPPSRRDTLRARVRARSEWVIPLAVLDALFLAFLVVQAAVMFGGRDHVLETAGVTYAEYARSGFFQLLAVAFLTLLVIAVAVHAARPSDPKDKTLLRILLAVLCVCILGMLVSAYQRLDLYEQEFGFTRLRIAVHAAILWLAAIFALVLAGGALWKARWLPRGAVLLSGAGLLVFSLLNPDALIARKNVQRYNDTGKLDRAYVSTLSADALPELLGLPEEELRCILAEFERTLPVDEPWTSWNLSRSHAEELLEERSPATCTVYEQSL